MTNRSSVRLFQELRKLKEKAVRYSFHQENYRFYKLNRLVPTGLQIRMDPALGPLSPELKRQWNNVLFSTSLSLIHLLIKHCESSLDRFTLDISRIQTELESSCSSTRFDQFMGEINTGLTRVRSDCRSRQSNKIGHIFHRQQQYRRRRWRQPAPTTVQETTDPESTVINLSSSTLSPAETNLLSKGLNFCPTPHTANQLEVSQDLTQFYRRIRLREFFLDSPPTPPEPFHCKSTWVPPKNRVPSLETYIQVVSSQINQTDLSCRRTNDNLPREQREALNSLRTRKDIIIKPADKGSGVVVMDRQQYIDEGMRQLSNHTNYKPLDSDPTGTFSKDIQRTLDDMRERDQISKKAHKFLSPRDCRTARFYLLPKIHKPGNPGRPIISSNGAPTERISLFVDSFLKPLVPKLPSYIHDTPDFLRKLTGIKDQIPATAIIGTFDVSSLYTNIPHKEGIEACVSALSNSGHTVPSLSDIADVMNHVLTKNNFTFMEKHYLQIHGTAMGTRMAPSMACLFMGKLEERMLASAPCRPWLWWRYIDDIFFIWTRDEESLLCFIDHINSFHRTIKFTSEYSPHEAHFLDVNVRKENNSLTTDLFVKPTDKHQYLHSTSCHPRHCKTGIAYSQALRLRRICSNQSDFVRHCRNLKKHLTSRGHSSRRVQKAINKVKSLPRDNVLAEKLPPKPKDGQVPLVLTYHPSLPPIRKIAHANHHILHTADRLQRAVPEPPIVAFRRPPNLRDILVRAAVPPTNDTVITPTEHGTFKCNSRCITCQHHVNESRSFTSHSTDSTFQTKGHITCNTSNVIYLISCRRCGIQYVGETKNTLKQRLYGHRSTIKTRKLDTPVGEHFNLPNHSIFDLSVQAIESLRNRSEIVRRSREKVWIKRLHTIQPHGLNIQEGND